MKHSVGQFLRLGELSELTQQALRLQKLQKLLPELLPVELAEQCHAVSLVQGCLLLEVNHGSAATVLRYYTPTLLSQIRQQSDFASLASIKHRVKVQTPSAPIVPKKNPHIAYSKKTSALLTVVAHKIDYAPLKQALLRLAEHI